MSRWVAIDEAHRLPDHDQDVVERLAESAADFGPLVAQLPAVLGQMRSHMEGQPRAAATDPGSKPPIVWCFDHDRAQSKCITARLQCPGELVESPSDPVGTVATAEDGDDAGAHYSELLRRLVRIRQDMNRAVELASKHPTNPGTPADAEEDDGVGELWCEVCWKDNKHREPISLNPKGRPYYKGKCKRCGEFEAAEKFEPPTWLLALRHRGTTITTGHIDKARREHRALKAASKKRTRKAQAKAVKNRAADHLASARIQARADRDGGSRP